MSKILKIDYASALCSNESSTNDSLASDRVKWDDVIDK
jgi:hypothetical protein